MIKAEIITIGDEILMGQITDTNSQWIGGELSKIGIQTVRKTSIGDVASDILKALSDAESRADLIIITGGLGPTKDDITKKTMAEYFSCEIQLHEKALEDVTVFFTERGKELSDTNRMQAYLPTACQYIQNTCGTAPGMWFEKGDKAFMSMPGVPFEMKELMRLSVLPRAQKKFKCPAIIHKHIVTIGIGESALSDLIQDWEVALPSHMKLAYLPSLGGLRLRLSCSGPSTEVLNEEANVILEKLIPLIDKYVFAFGDQSLEKAMGNYLHEKKLTLSIAESCTGGYLSHLITSLPGSSDYFKGAVVAYHNDVKMQELGVSLDTIQTHGAVSEETVRQMAEAVRKKLHTDIGLSVSGIAGPGGGTEEKPVGTVWIAYADGTKTVSKKLQLGKLRENNIRMASYALLDMMRREQEVKPDVNLLWKI